MERHTKVKVKVKISVLSTDIFHCAPDCKWLWSGMDYPRNNTLKRCKLFDMVKLEHGERCIQCLDGTENV
jgi:hypothetical protein